ncbi:MAG TPA: tripartite tricarboxylate transporter TctB family protein [Clostridia bacterium]|nr:tripartite tricarboxylate transporter TctB family protein [Clostridia bacterium]
MNITSHANRKKLVDRLFTIAIIVLFTIVIVMTFSLSETAGSVPRLISIIGIVLSVITLVKDFKQNDGKPKNNDAASDENQGMSFIKCFGLLIAYLAAMVVLGFAISTCLMLFFIPIFLKYRNLKINIIFSVITTAVLYFSFTYLFYVRLPVGILFELFL